MSLSSTTARQQFAGDGSTVLFAVPFYFETLSTDVKAFKTSSAGVDTELTYVAGSSPGAGQFALVSTTLTGNLYTAANVKTGDTLSSSEKLTILRGIPLKQTTDVQAADGFPPETAELTWDRAVMMMQELRELIARTVKFRAGYNTADVSMADPSASKYLRWNSGATALENVSLLSTDGLQVEKGVAALGSGITSYAVTFVATIADASYIPSFWFINTTDSNPIIMSGIVTAKSSGGFTVTFPVATDTANYLMAWSAMGDPS